MNAEVDTEESAKEGAEFHYRSFYVGVRPYVKYEDYNYEDRVSWDKVEEIAQQFNDVSYNRSSMFRTAVMYRQTVSLDIVSDTYYNAAHPAGTLLNDMVTVDYLCCDKILNPPYNFELSAEQKSTRKQPYEFREKLSDFNQLKPTLVSFWFDLRFTVAPATTSTHRFTVTYKNIDGVELSATTEPVTILQ